MRYWKRVWGAIVFVGWVVLAGSGCFSPAGNGCTKEGDCFKGERCVSGTCTEAEPADSGPTDVREDGGDDVADVEPDGDQMPDGGDVEPDAADRPAVDFISPRAGATVAAHRDVVVEIGGTGEEASPVLTANGKEVGTMEPVSGAARRYRAFWEMEDPSDNEEKTEVRLKVTVQVDGRSVEEEIEVSVDCKGDFYPDADGDGYGAGTQQDVNERDSCEEELGPDEQEVPPGDCNDREASVYPGAKEWCDGLNNDCGEAAEPDACGRELGIGDINVKDLSEAPDTEVLDVAVVPGRGIVFVGRTGEAIGQAAAASGETAGFVGFLPRWEIDGDPSFTFRTSADSHQAEEFRSVEITESGRAVVLGGNRKSAADTETVVLVYELTDNGPKRVGEPIELFSGEKENFLARDLTLGQQNDTESFYLAGRAAGKFPVDGMSKNVQIGSANVGVAAVFYWSDLRGGAPDAYYGEEREGLSSDNSFEAIDYDEAYASGRKTSPVGVFVAGSDEEGIGFYRGLRPYEPGGGSGLERRLTSSGGEDGLYDPKGTDKLMGAYRNITLADVAAVEAEGYAVGFQLNTEGMQEVLKGVGFFMPLAMGATHGGEVGPWTDELGYFRAIAPFDETRLVVTATVPVGGKVGGRRNTTDAGGQPGRERCAVGYLHRRDTSERTEEGRPSSMKWLDWEPRKDDLRPVDCLSVDVSPSTGWGAVGVGTPKAGVLFTRNL